MKVFISSAMSGYDEYRSAAASAARTLECVVMRAEDFGASPDTPQQACLAAAREADVTLVILGGRYGIRQASGLSPTHEEFREARDHGRLLVFVEQGVTREPHQEDFVQEARQWASGVYTASFSTPDELRDAVTRDLHRMTLSQLSAASEPAEMAERARSRIKAQGGYSGSWLHFVVVGGPPLEVLPPSLATDVALQESLEQLALFGHTSIFDRAAGARTISINSGLIVEQPDASATITDDGIVHVRRPTPRSSGTLPAIIEEDVTSALESCVAFTAAALDLIDPVRRLRDILTLTALEGSILGWRTAAEHQASPNSMSMGLGTSDDVPVLVPDRPKVRPRADLSAGRSALVADHVARLAQSVRGHH